MGTVHVVSTPIGNLEDVTLRAIRVLAEADLVLAEDTRRSRILLERHGVKARPLSLHAHNEAARVEQTLERLRAGEAVALISDAGTPLVSDPGQRLIAAAIADGHQVTAVPGASAVLAALSVSGLRAAPFTFLGFLPRRAGARDALLGGYRDRAETLVLFESPRRTARTLRALTEALGARRACVARELTKLHEEVARGSLSELAERFADGARGEVTIVVEGAAEPARLRAGADEAAADCGALDTRIRELLARGQSPREIAAQLAAGARLRKRDVYARAVAAKQACEAAAHGKHAEGVRAARRSRAEAGPRQTGAAERRRAPAKQACEAGAQRGAAERRPAPAEQGREAAAQRASEAEGRAASERRRAPAKRDRR